jgi:DNA-binding NtrC family response regulator
VSSILIINEDKLVLDLLSKFMRDLGFDVDSAMSVREALDRLQVRIPEIVLIDPKISGVTSLLEPGVRIKEIFALVGDDHGRTLAARWGLRILDRRQGLSELKMLGADSQAHEGVLIIDDDEGVRRVISSSLERNGYLVFGSATAADGLNQLNTTPAIKVVLLDVVLPDRGGIEVLREILKRNPAPQVIMMSGLADREIARQALKLGTFDYILKPVDLNSLNAAVSTCMLRAG